MTILKTQTAVINRKKVTVETIATDSRSQNISYKVNGRLVPFDAFWELGPKFKK